MYRSSGVCFFESMHDLQGADKHKRTLALEVGNIKRYARCELK